MAVPWARIKIASGLALITLAGVVWRWVLFSGDGLGDDPNFFSAYHGILVSHEWKPLAYNYRPGLWFPILLSWRLFGVSEWSWILPITVASALGIPVTYLLGRKLVSPSVGLIAAVLLAVHPFDVLTSTLFVNDVPFALSVALAMLCFVWGLKTERARPARGWFFLASVFVFWSYVTKMWGIFTLPILAVVSILYYRHWKRWIAFYAGVLALFSVSFLVDFVLSGHPFGYYQAEVGIAGLWPITLTTLLEYPRQMFLPNQYGHFFHGVYLWAAIPVVVLSWFWRRHALIPAVWVALSFLTMEFMPQKATWEDWYSQARIFRYLSVLVIPTCLLLALAADRISQRRRRPAWVLLSVFVGVALIQGYQVTTPSRDAFDDVRQAARKLVALDSKKAYSDYHMISHIERFYDRYGKPETRGFVRSENPTGRNAEFLEISDAYVITGGGRLPYYGCNHCVANLGTFAVPEYWKLLWTLDKPQRPWRSEPLRIWEVGSPSGPPPVGQDADAALRAALAHFHGQRYGEAVSAFERIRSTWPDSPVVPVAWWYQGITAMRLRDPARALDIFQRWLDTFPQHPLEPEIHYHMGVCYRDLGQFEPALQALNRVLQRFPDAPAAAGSRSLIEELRARSDPPR